MLKSIVFDTFYTKLKDSQDTRDIRDPTAIGELLLKPSKYESILKKADQLSSVKIPKYKE